MVLPLLSSSSGGVVAGSVNKLLFDVLYQLEKDAGKVLVVTAFSALAPSFSKLPIKSSTVVLGALALAATLLGTQLVGHASIEKGLDRGGAASLLLAVALLVVALLINVVIFVRHRDFIFPLVLAWASFAVSD